MEDKPWAHVTDETRDKALDELKAAMEKYLQTVFADDTAQLFGHVLQMSGSGVLSGETVTWTRSGTTTEKLGLLALLQSNVETTCIPQLSLEADDE